MPSGIYERTAKMKTGKYIRTEKHKGQYANNFRGGKINRHGYVAILQSNHPYANKDGYIMEHRLIIEKYIGRYLDRKEVTHHINEIKDDNRLKNLMIFKNGSYHCNYHRGFKINPIGIVFDGRRI